MYAWVWRVLPGPLVVKIFTTVVLIVAVVVVLFLWVFPWVAPLLPFQDQTVAE